MLNCDNSLEPFTRIVPCGITDAGVTTLSETVGSDISPTDAAGVVASAFDGAFGMDVAA